MVTRAEIIRALEATRQAGCWFSVGFRAPFGGQEAELTPEDIAACILDGVNLPARKTGLTPDEYAEWIEQDGHVQCSAKTKAGRQCRKSASGAAVTDPAEWKALRATAPYCPIHGG
ncbi:hypothetical protein P3W85_29860 [Cupriavidus basilensis]|uniref:Uncharacterized protein n=1 Tax=Cupriavidus basilensis TaxID=68895 RepID=A0ABT6AXC0_9BURK|nr:hypothetical protein [Cupriavidus basilensis]MDF3837129.1 hypothetical protein [Cupriavidus basilensis]